ncbi:MAG: ATP-binding cassette domain-containing protein [Anaerovoracaceae bacterium]
MNDFTFTAQPGQRVAIVGPTGAGKTTIVKLLMRFYELDGGSITIDGHDITDFSRRQDLRQMFGMVLQDTWLNNGTIREKTSGTAVPTPLMRKWKELQRPLI